MACWRAARRVEDRASRRRATCRRARGTLLALTIAGARCARRRFDQLEIVEATSTDDRARRTPAPRTATRRTHRLHDILPAHATRRRRVTPPPSPPGRPPPPATCAGPEPRRRHARASEWRLLFVFRGHDRAQLESGAAPVPSHAFGEPRARSRVDSASRSSPPRMRSTRSRPRAMPRTRSASIYSAHRVTVLRTTTEEGRAAQAECSSLRHVSRRFQHAAAIEHSALVQAARRGLCATRRLVASERGRAPDVRPHKPTKSVGRRRAATARQHRRNAARGGPLFT